MTIDADIKKLDDEALIHLAHLMAWQINDDIEKRVTKRGPHQHLLKRAAMVEAEIESRLIARTKA